MPMEDLERDVPQSAFHSLLVRLATEHDRELDALKVEIARLTAESGENQRDANSIMSMKRSSTTTAGSVATPFNFHMDGHERIPRHVSALERGWEKASNYVPHGRVRDGVSDCASWWSEVKEPTRSGPLARFAGGAVFGAACFFAICLNAVFIMLTVDLEMKRALRPGSVDYKVLGADPDSIDMCFTVFYVVELAIRLAVHRLFFFSNEDWAWNHMDVALALFAIMESVANNSGGARAGPNMKVLRLVRILKVMKVFRLVRVVEFFRELRLMVNCIVNSVAPLFWCIVLLSLTIFVYAVLLVQLLSEHIELERDWLEQDAVLYAKVDKSFGNVHKAMISLFQATSGGVDWQEDYDIVNSAGTPPGLVYLFFIVFWVIVAWNVVASTFVEKALVLALPEVETLINDKRKADIRDAMDLETIVSGIIDEDCDGKISAEEFNKHITNPQLSEFFTARGLDIKDTQTFFHMLQTLGQEDHHVDIRTFVGGALRLRGAAATIDLQAFHFDVRSNFFKQQERLRNIEALLKGSMKLWNESHATWPQLSHQSPSGSPTLGGADDSAAVKSAL